jgi:rod shape-determining protein MreC
VNRRAQSRSSGLFLTTAAALIALVGLTQLPPAAGPRGYLKDAVAPVAVVTSGFLDWAGNGLALAGQAARLRGDNNRLAAENASLRRQVAELQAAGQENADLRKAIAFEKGFGHHLLAAAVIGRAPDGLTRSVTIGRGRADGVAVGMVVVSGAGLVGRVSEVSERSATVRTLVDAASRVNSYTSKAGLEGTVLGEGGPLGMEMLPKPGVVVAPGEWVLTSGIGGLFPRGLLVGQVTQFHRRDSATLERADLAPAVDFGSVSTVLVVTDFKPAAP